MEIPKRVRLHFPDDEFPFLDQDLRKCLFLVPTSMVLVGDLLHHISKKFSLSKHCPEGTQIVCTNQSKGIQLCIEDFSIPPSQDISIVRETDTITFVVQKSG